MRSSWRRSYLLGPVNCESKYDKSKQGNADISTSTDCSASLGVDKWLEDYERAEEERGC